MMQPPPNPIAALFANLRRPQIYGGNPFQMQTQQQAESQVDAVGAPPPAPAPAPSGRRPAPPRGNSFMDSRGFRIADAVLGGATISEARAGLDAQEAAQARQQEMAALADSLNMDPQERLIFMTDPEAWAKAQSTAMETRVLGHGDTLHTPGGEDYQPGITPYDQRSMDDAKAKAEADRARMVAADEERARANRAREGLAGARENRVAGNARARSRPAPPRAPAANPWDKYR